MRYLHTMIRVADLDKTIHFFKTYLDLKEVRRVENEAGHFTLVFLATEEGALPIELTYNWDQAKPYSSGNNFGHLAYAVPNIYEICEKMQKDGILILRPPHDGNMAFVKTPDGISIELLQDGSALPPREPWSSMPNQGSW